MNAAPGYRSIRFAPQPGGGLTYAEAEHETPYGRAAIAWRIDDGRIEAAPGIGEAIRVDAELFLQHAP